MSFVAGGSSEEAHHQLWFLIPSQQQAAAVQLHPFAMDRRPARRRGDPHPHRRGASAMHGAVEQQQKQHRGRAPHGTGTGARRGQQALPVPPTPAGYFTAELVLAFLLVAVSLAFLPLVLPPLSPPPFLLLLVPVGLLAVLLALAFVPLDAHSHFVGVGTSPR